PGAPAARLGPDGAGRPRLPRPIAGLRPVRGGQIRFPGAPIERLPPWTRIRLGMAHAPEGRQVVGGLTVADNLRLGAYALRRRRSESWIGGGAPAGRGAVLPLRRGGRSERRPAPRPRATKTARA